MLARRGRFTLMRVISEPEKKVVAARQGWTCSNCSQLLPAAYQVDHTVPLCDGGSDDISNCTAMCANCHAAKTQLEGIERRKQSQSVAEQYASREDVYVRGGTHVKCSLCKRVRRQDCAHTFCTGIEAGHARGLTFALARFAFKPRGKACGLGALSPGTLIDTRYPAPTARSDKPVVGQHAFVQPLDP